MKSINLIFYLFITLMLIILNSCCGFLNITNDKCYNSKIKYAINLITRDTIKYIYDDSGKILEYNYKSISLKYEEIRQYKYYDSNIFLTKTYNGKVSYDTLYLNAKGLVVYSSGVRSNGKHTNTQYFYNDEGYRIKQIVDYTDTSEYFYKDNNLIEIKSKKLSGINEYYTDKINTTGNINKGQEFYGKSSKNLKNKFVKTKGDISEYIYIFDSKDRVSMLKSTSSKTGVESGFQYIYED